MANIPDELGQARRARILFAVSIVGLALYVVLDAVAQSLPPHYSPISQAEGDLAVGPYGYVMTLNFINRGIFSLSFLLALALTANSADVMSVRFRRGAYLFAFWSVGALLLAAFPADVAPAPVTWQGVVHLAAGTLAFFGGAAGALYISLGMARNRPLARVRGTALTLASISAVLLAVELVMSVVPGVYADYGGLLERLFLASMFLWIGAVSFVMLFEPSGPVGPAELRPGASSLR